MAVLGCHWHPLISLRRGEEIGMVGFGRKEKLKSKIEKKATLKTGARVGFGIENAFQMGLE